VNKDIVTTGSGNVCTLTIDTQGKNVGIEGSWKHKPTQQDLDDVNAYCAAKFHAVAVEVYNWGKTSPERLAAMRSDIQHFLETGEATPGSRVWKKPSVQ
jgi:hypothetical protein